MSAEAARPGIFEDVDRPAIELVVTDLDGTLLDPEEGIHPLALAAVVGLIDRGVQVLVATGRRHRTALPILSGAGLSLPGIYQDGAVGVHADGARFHLDAFTKEAASRVFEALAGLGVAPLIVVDRPEADLVVTPGYTGSPAHLERNRRWIAGEDPARALAEETILTFIVSGVDPEILGPVEDRLKGLASASVTPDLHYGGVTLQVLPPGVSKWTGVSTYCRLKGIDEGRVLAVGDGANDLELLRGSRVACVMANGVPEAVALADHVLPPATAGGWAGVADLVD
ncbi:MAG TPA: HAD family hydrolase [Candidatus Dormibacteraeota bacterium]|nr:HAD family hydrolase [Candidatus Dormibacteraeota bacterium]